MDWKVPFSDAVIGDDEISSVTNVLKSGWITQGPQVEAFEKEFADAFGDVRAVAVTNGTAALHIAYTLAGLTPGAHFCIPALTFAATMNAGLYNGAKPILIDCVSEDNLTMSPDDLKNKITPETSLVVTMPYGGFPPMMKEIMDIAAENDAAVVEDACHAPLAEYKYPDSGKLQKIGTFGLLSTYSFYGNKNITTGEGGMILTSSDELAEKIKILRSHGMSSPTIERFRGKGYSYDIVSPGFNYRLDEIRAALGRAQLKNLPEFNRIRTHNAVKLRSALESLNISDLKIPFSKPDGIPVHHVFAVLLPRGTDRVDFAGFLKEKKSIQTSLHYPDMRNFSYAEEVLGEIPKLPVLDSIAGRLMSLPMHATLTDEQIAYIAESFNEYFK